jgi:hypothetical protein
LPGCAKAKNGDSKMTDFVVFAKDENAQVVYRTTVISNFETVDAIQAGRTAFFEDEAKQPPIDWVWHATPK